MLGLMEEWRAEKWNTLRPLFRAVECP